MFMIYWLVQCVVLLSVVVFVIRRSCLFLSLGFIYLSICILMYFVIV